MTPFGPYQMRVMTFSFANMPSCFQRYMDKVFTLLLNKNLENYLDNVLNHHKTKAEHIKGVRDMLQCLQDAKLFCNAKKCEFHQKKIEFLGVDVSHEGFEMDDKKITDVVQWQWPTTVQGVHEFISFINFYQHWIPGFSDVAKPLHTLFQKDHKWDWTENKQTAFEILKWGVSQAPILVHANPERAFRMETNASNYVYGAVLSQKQTDGQHHLIRYMSKSMNLVEQNYGIPDKEALAIVKGLQNWRHWLKRMKLPVQILTDHKNLEYFARPCILNRRQMRWLEMLMHYNYEIHYHPGNKNCAANALSRRVELCPPDREDDIPQCLIPEAKFTELAACKAGMTDSDWVDLTNIILAALAFSDEHLLSDTCQISRDWEDKPEGLVWDNGLGRKDGRIWILEDDGLWKKVMRLYHDSPVMGHLGTSGTLELVSQSYWHWNLPNWVKRYVQGCHTCRQVKHRNQCEHGKLQPIPTPDGPWQWIQSDFVGELPKSDGFNAIYVVSDQLTKMVHFIPTTMDISAPDLMKLHIHHVWKLHRTDRGSMFTANFTKSIYKDLGIEPQFSMAYHPQTQGQVENNNKWMETYLRMFCSHRQDNWADLLPTAEFAYNNHHHPSIDTTPFFANYGYHPTLMNIPCAAQSGEPDERIQRIHDTQAECKRTIERSQDISK
jgi:hypothetical protein